jgi:tetratricopeptide (TPR) repeat protein
MMHSERDPERVGSAVSGEPGTNASDKSASARSTAVPQRNTAAARMEGLPANAMRSLPLAARHLDLRQLDSAADALREAIAIAPTHPEILRLQGVLAYRQGRFDDAIALVRRTLAAWPDDAAALGNLGSALADSGRVDEALATMRRASEVAPQLASTWFNLGKLLDSQAYIDEAEPALRKAIELAPNHLPSRIAHAAVLATLGRTSDAAAAYRDALAKNARSVQAWLGLVNLKTERLGADEVAALENLHADPTLSEDDRTVAGFALGKVLEDSGRHADAFAVLSTANAMRRRRFGWDATAFSQRVDAIAAAFESAPESAVADATLGESVIFVVSLPRSGSTLVEQILAAHPDVEGASELPDLEAVIVEESARRNARFPDWVATATPADWQRMGQRYLQRTERWRARHPRFTDKMPDNWLMVGAALAMLPGAHVVNVRRDAVETCWSCFKQMFATGRHTYSYDLADLAETWRDYDRLCRAWSERFPERVREQSYESLLADPENETRALLEFCGLPFDAASLRPHEAERSVRTASAAQVREPLRRDTARSAGYGALLEPLRNMLDAAAAANSAVTKPQADVVGAAPERPRSERVADLDDAQARELLRAAALLSSGRAEEAAPIIERAQAQHAEHPEVLRLFGALNSAQGRHAPALAALRHAAELKVDDALILNTLGTAQIAAGDVDAALASFRRACEIDPAAAGAAHNLGNALAARGDTASARDAFVRAVAAEPGFVPARVALAQTLQTLGQSDEAAAEFRKALDDDPRSSAAWQGLAELRAAEFSAAERSALEREYQRPRLLDSERAALGFALGNVLEARARYPEAFSSFLGANALRRRELRWNRARYSRYCDQVLEAFPAAAADSPESNLGEGHIFLMAMPDAFASNVARALRAHPDIASHAPVDPTRVLAIESKRRGRKFQEWAAQATPADWQRLGRVYADQAKSHGTSSHRLIDATTFSTALAGAVAQMLPRARFVAIRNDALDTCWSCFKSDFRSGHAYSYDFAELVACWHDHQRLLQRWVERHPERIHFVDAADVRAQPAFAIERLLTDCGLAPSDAIAKIANTLQTYDRVAATAYGDLLKPLAQMVNAGEPRQEIG